MIEIFRKAKDYQIRWGPADKFQAVTLRKWLFALLGGSVALGIILTMGGYIVINHFYTQNRDVKLITALIMEANPSFDPIYANVTAKYIVTNSGIYDPVWITVIGCEEGSWVQKSKSDKGAEGFFQIKPCGDEHKLSKEQRLFLEYQLEKAIGRLDGFYKGSIYGMHFDYVGAKKNKHIADAYIARIYAKAAKARGWIWKKRPKEE